MDVYQTEEEQVESIKKWWAENSRSIIFGVGLGLIGLFGWQSWQEKTRTHVLEASDTYQSLAQSMKDSKFDAAILLANEIDETYSDTPYAALAGMHKAKAQIETGDRKGAIESLEKVATTADNNSIQHIARVRAFKLRIADGDMTGVIADIDSVIAEENGINPGEFIGQYEALKGDAYRLLGDVEKARHGYIAALRNATLDRRLIQLKLDDLGPPPANFADVNNDPAKETEK
ncbi:MAG: tetratricopeptide repeat protein [Cycloclasticus sp.]|jgi:predicted negative regulator of RcsB-dependent stress response|nr:tetratricopeptide repeat protein [Cycloclasticus sp.]MDF1689617.1 tetratricopeptide repeat protein [Cycloclasticus sp.]MEE4290321.1 tetratricopeptide repeat protein [Cycloclasticus sp.]